MKQKIIVSPRELVIKSKTLFGKDEKVKVFEINRATNYTPKRPFLFPNELDYLKEMGVEVEINGLLNL